MSRPFNSRYSAPQTFVRVNNKIRAREVRVIDDHGQQLGVISIHEALGLVWTRGVDLVEVAPNANPPVCRLVDFGKYRYEQVKKEKEAKKHQHANRVKEIQLSPNIDPHDFGVKLHHAIDFLCEEMKVKVTLRFRGREMAHQEYGFQKIHDFIKEIAPFGHPDFPPKLIGKGINLMLSPLPRNKRAKNPHEGMEPPPPLPELEVDEDDEEFAEEEESENENEAALPKEQPKHNKQKKRPANDAAENDFGQNPFANLDLEKKDETNKE